ncbi:MAG TPA: copper-binding protein [Rubrivivax sp.]|jgi:Cu(I)/Ag(I) efflux system protein CusF|nr:copper-binding protein [Rubrivivax sp.]
MHTARPITRPIARPITRPITLLVTRLMLIAAASMPAVAQATEVDGEVVKLDRAQSRLTLRHGEIRSLDMPAMTMVFRAAQPALLDGLNVGDRVRFAAAKVDGHYTVTAIAKAR